MVIIPNIEDYTCKISTILEDPAYRRLDKHPTEAIERKTSTLIRRFSLPKEVAKLL
jgi:hypothetical protein